MNEPTNGTWSLENYPTEKGDRVNITFSASGPATFTLMVDKKGNTILFGYESPVTDESEPMLVFDTDGSKWIDPAKRVFFHEAYDENDSQKTGYYRTDLIDRGPWATEALAANA